MRSRKILALIIAISVCVSMMFFAIAAASCKETVNETLQILIQNNVINE